MRLLYACVVMLVAGCRATGPSLSVTPGEPVDVTLARGEEARFGEEPLRVEFRDVFEDSRCPLDVVCVWEGNGRIGLAMELGESPRTIAILNTTGGAGAGSVEIGNYRISLLGLRPDPISTRPIPPDTYLVQLRVERLSDPR